MPLSFWRDLALILLALEVIVAMLAPLVLLYLANRGLHWFRVRAGIYLPIAGYYVRQGQDITARGCGLLTAPLVKTQARLAGAGAMFGKLWRHQQ
jgi:hypothetical protein